MSEAPSAAKAVEAIASSVGRAAERFLTDPDWRDSIDEILGWLSDATHTSVTLVRADDPDASDEEKTGPGTLPSAWDEGWREAVATLGEGGVIETEHLLMLPVVVRASLWGALRLDAKETQRWPDAEIRALEGFCRALGAAVDRSRSDRDRREAEAKYQALVEHLPAVVYISELGDEGEWLYISPHIQDMIGYTPDEWIAHPGPFTMHVHPEDLERSLAAEEARAAAVEGGEEDDQTLKQEYRMYDRAGNLKWVRDESRLIRDENGNPWFLQGVMFDVTREKEVEQQVAFMAYHDALTGLPNRVMFEEHLDLALARADPDHTAAAVAFLDLDGFKDLNDTQGHAAGDVLLKQVAGRLQLAMRETDLVARQGGDEFLVLLADIDRSKGPEAVYAVAVTIANRIHESLKATFTLRNLEHTITTSIGICAYPEDANSSQELLKNADAAMYRSKAAGAGLTTSAPDEG